VQFQRFNLRQSFLHCLHQQLLKSADRRSKNQNVNFSRDTQYLGLHVTALLTFHDFVDCKVNVQRSVVNYMAGAMRSLSARCVKESRAVPDGAAVVGTAVDGPDVTTAITHIQTHISLALTAVS